jgi:hypothetical protein
MMSTTSRYRCAKRAVGVLGELEESVVSVDAGLDLVDELLGSGMGSSQIILVSTEVLVVLAVHGDITGLNLARLGGLRSLSLGEDEGESLGLALESTNAHVSPGEVTILHDVRLSGELLDSLELVTERLLHANAVSVLHPGDRVEITQAGAKLNAVDNIIRGAIATPAALLSVRGGGGIDVEIGGQETLEHGAGLASFHVEDELAVHLLGEHALESSVEARGLEVGANREGNDAGSSVVSEEDEDIILRSRLEDLASGLDASRVAGDDVDEGVSGHIVAGVVLLAASINIVAGCTLSSGLVEELALGRVLRVVGNVVKVHHNNALRGDTAILHNLEGVASISLVTIVVIAIGTGNNDGPRVASCIG